MGTGARIARSFGRRLVWLFAGTVLLSAFALHIPLAAHATDCSGPDPFTATTDTGLVDIINTGGACTAPDGGTVTIVGQAGGGTYALAAPLTVTQSNLTVQGPQSGDPVVILGPDAGTRDVVDLAAGTAAHPNSLTLKNVSLRGAFTGATGALVAQGAFDTISLLNSDIENNNATGVVANGGSTVNVVNSTITLNTAVGAGGGISALSGGAVN